MKNKIHILNSKFLCILALIFIGLNSFAVTNTYQGATGNVNWQTGANWSQGHAPAATEDVVFNTSGSITFTTGLAASVSINSLTISQGTVTIIGAAAYTITIGGNAGTDLVISNGAALVLSTNLNITMAASATSDISGSFTINASRTFDTDAVSVVSTVSSTGSITNAGTVTCTSASKLIFEGSSTYSQSSSNTVPTADWDGALGTATTTCTISATSLPATTGLSGQTFYHLTFSGAIAINFQCSFSTSGNLTFSSLGTRSAMTNTGSGYTWNIGGNFIISAASGTFHLINSSGNANCIINVTGDFQKSGASTFDFAYSGAGCSGSGTTQTLNIGGNFTHTAGTISNTCGCTAVVNFNGSGTQYIESTGQSNAITFKTTQLVAAAKVVVNDTKTFTLGSSSTFLVQDNTLATANELEIGTGTSGVFSVTNTTANSFTLNSGAKLKVFSSAQFKVQSSIVNNGSNNITIDGTYEHIMNGGSLPSATWSTSSTCLITGAAGTTAISNVGGQTYGNFTMNWTSISGSNNIALASTGNIVVQGDLTWNPTITSGYYLSLFGSGSHTLDVYGDFIMSSGSSNFRFEQGGAGSETLIFNLKGNFNKTNGVFEHTNSSSNLAINFAGTSNQTFTNSAGTLTNTYINWTVNSAAILTLASDLPVATSRSATVTGTLICGTGASQKNVTGAGSFILSNASTAELRITNSTAGITALGTATGNILTTGARTFNTGAKYYYMGNAAQITGTGLPSQCYTLTIDNTSGVTLTAACEATNTLVLTNGILTSTTGNLMYVSSTSTSAITGYSSSNYVSGPLKWALANSAGTYIFPVGKGGNYYPFTFSSHTSTSPILQVESFNSACGGSGLTLSSTEYWKVDYTNTITAGIVTLQRSTAFNGINIVGTCGTSNGSYSSLGRGTWTAYSMTASTSIGTVSNTTKYYALGLSCSTYGTVGITTTYTVGTQGEVFASMNDAITSLNTCGYNGHILLSLTTNYDGTSTTEGSANPMITIPSTFNSVASSNTRTITVQPAVNGLSITSSSTTGTILFNGTDYFYFSGSSLGTPSMENTNNLTISNTSTSGYTFKFIADATYNKLEYCNIKGVNTSTSNGTIWFSTGTATGNDYNQINYCEIFAGASNPTNAIYSLGSVANTDNVTINGNYIYDYFYVSGASNGILLSDYNSVWNITNNKFYQTATITQTSAFQHSSINITNSASPGISFTITGNTIGYASSSSTGTYTLVGVAGSNGTKLVPIYLNLGTNASTIHSNTIAGIDLSSTKNTVNYTSPGTFTGIYLHAGAANIGASGNPNVIGATTGTGSITHSSTVSGGYIFGIMSLSTSSVNISYNNIGSITTSSSTGATIVYNFWGIYTNGASTTTITYNNIGSSSTANSISVGYSGTSTSSANNFVGIEDASTSGGKSINYNSIYNCSVFGSSATTGTLYGIYYSSSTSTTSSISYNTINTLSNQAGDVIGIYDAATTATAHTIQYNTIGTTSSNNITCTSATSLSNAGIYVSSTGTYTINNNTIRNITCSGASASVLYGILCGSTGTYTLTSNSIANLKNSNTGNYQSTVAGIYFSASATTGRCYKNTITNLLNGSAGVVATSNPNLFGIYYANTNNTHYITNNFIYLDNTGYTTQNAMSGITANSSGTATYHIYYNTVYIDGTDNGASGSTTYYGVCLDVANGYTNCYVRNNLFFNDRSSTNNSTRHACIKYSNTTTTYTFDYNYGWRSIAGVANAASFATYSNGTLVTASAWQAIVAFTVTNDKNNNNSSVITVNTDASLSATDIVTVGTGYNLSNSGSYPNCQDDIYSTAGTRGSAGGTRGCYEGAASYYWVGGTGNWSDYTNHWASISGGSPNLLSAPSSSNNVYFDGNSTGGICTIDASATCLTFTGTGYTGTIAGTFGLTISGNLVVGSGMTWSQTGTLTFNATATGKTITANSVSLACPLTFNGSGGGWTLQDNLTLSTTSALTLTAGTLDLSSRTLSIAGDFTKATAFTFTPNTGTVTFTGNSSAINGTTVAPTFYNVIVNKTAGQTLSTGGSVTSMTCSNNFTETTGNFTAPTNMTVSGNVTLTAGTFTAPSGTLSVVGNFVNNGATFTHNSGTVSFDGTTTQTVTPNGIGVGNQFYNVTINNSYATPSNTYSVDASAIYVANTTTVTDGQFYPTTGSYFKDVTIGVNGVLKPRLSATIYVSGNWTNSASGTFTANGGTVIFNGTSTIISGGTATTQLFYNVTVDGVSTTLSTNSLNVNYDLTITSGTFNSNGKTVYVGRNWTNNSTYTAGISLVQFFRSMNSTVSGSSTTTFYEVEVDKGSDTTYYVDISVPVTISYDVTYTNGMFVFNNSSINVTDRINSTTDVAATAGLVFKDGTYDARHATWLFNNDGYTRISGGTVYFGISADKGFKNGVATSIFKQTGGTIYVAGNFYGIAGKATFTSGSMYVNQVGYTGDALGSFEIDAASDLTISGGTIYYESPNASATGYDVYIIAGGTKSITGGTFQIGDASTGSSKTFLINSAVSLYNLTINSTNTPTVKLSAALTVSNAFTNGGVFDANASGPYGLTIGGAFTNNGTFTARTATVTFNGGSAQTISGTTDPNFYNFTLNNASGASIGLNTTVQGTFTFTLGKFTTQGYTLTIGTNGSVSGYTSARYFVAYDNSGTIGSVKQFINLKASTAYYYPIGDLTNYTPFTFTVNAASTLAAGAYFTMYTKAATISGLSASVTTYLTRFWRGTDSGITTPNYDISYAYSATDVIGGTEANLMPIKKSGATWYKPTGSTFTNGTAVGTGGFTVGTRTLTWAGLTSFSDYGGVGPAAVGLPIELFKFEGKKSGNDNELFWSTQTEINNDFFTIEKTTDGVTFETVGTQNGAGNSNYSLNYNLVDQNVQKVINYYRLIQTDTDGKNTISSLISIDNRVIESSEKVISSITNILGQEINDSYRGLIIITYNDGSSIKTIR